MENGFKAIKNIVAIIMLIVIIHTVISACNAPTPENEKFDWNNPKDVNNFLKWKDEHGSGWSNN